MPSPDPIYFIIKIFYLFYVFGFMHVCLLYVCLCAMCMPGDMEATRGCWIPWEWSYMSHHINAGNHTWDPLEERLMLLTTELSALV